MHYYKGMLTVIAVPLFLSPWILLQRIKSRLRSHDLDVGSMGQKPITKSRSSKVTISKKRIQHEASGPLPRTPTPSAVFPDSDGNVFTLKIRATIYKLISDRETDFFAVLQLVQSFP